MLGVMYSWVLWFCHLIFVNLVREKRFQCLPFISGNTSEIQELNHNLCNAAIIERLKLLAAYLASSITKQRWDNVIFIVVFLVVSSPIAMQLS